MSKAVGVGLAMAVVAGIGVGTYVHHEAFGGEPTDQEVAIANTVNETMAQDASIHCVTPEQMGRRTWGDEESGGASIPYMNTVWLAQVVCDRITAFAADPPTTKEIQAIGEKKGRARAEQTAALQILAFEVIKADGMFRRDPAMCGAANKVGTLAMAYGLKPKQAQLLDAMNRMIWSDGTEGNEGPAGYSLKDCP